MQEIFLRSREVQKVTGLSQSTIYRRMHEGSFPRQFRIGMRAVGWRREDIEVWARQRINQSADTA